MINNKSNSNANSTQRRKPKRQPRKKQQQSNPKYQHKPKPSKKSRSNLGNSRPRMPRPPQAKHITVYKKIRKHLDKSRIPYKLVSHTPTRTSEDSAQARGEDIKIGGKAIVMKVNDDFKLFVLSAALKIDSHKIKDFFNTKRIRFAEPEELKELTGLEPGSVPPFGRPILELDLYVDHSIFKNDRIAFNAGSLTDSIIMSTKDYLMMSNPQVIDFSQE